MLMIEWAQQKHEHLKPIPEKKTKNKTLGHISMKLKNIFGWCYFSFYQCIEWFSEFFSFSENSENET